MDIQTSYETRHRVKAQAFSTEHIAQYALCIHVSASHVALGVLDKAEARCLAYEHYPLPQLPNERYLIDFLEGLFRDHAYLSAGYWQKVVLVNSDAAFSFVPQALYDESQLASYLAPNCRVDKATSFVLSTPHHSQGAVNVFAMSKALAELLESKFTKCPVVFANYSGALLSGLLAQPHTLDSRYLHLLLDGDKLSIALFRNGNLHFFNTFACHSVEDFLYFVLFATEEHKLSQDDTQVLLYGEGLHGTAKLQKVLKEYFRQVGTGKRPSGLRFGYEFDELPEHLGLEVWGGLLLA